MKLTPVREYRLPDYPTQEILLEHPELLRVVPKRWQKNAVLLGTLAGLLGIIEQCGANAGEPAKAKEVPLFVHGDGRGAFGCIAVNPPVFLTEEEARSVIQDEAAKAGIHLETTGHIVPKVEVPITDTQAFIARLPGHEKEQPKDPKTSKVMDLTLDGWDEKAGIGYEFISEKDFQDWERNDQTVHSTVDEFDVLGAAKVLRKGLDQKSAGVIAVFYEPLVSPPKSSPSEGLVEHSDAYYRQLEQEAKRVNRDELRKQVQDFIAWLKAQGII